MNSIRVKLTIATVVILGAVTYLAVAGAKGGWVYHLTVDQYLTDAQYRNQHVRLCGRVDDKAFATNPAGLTANFVLKGTANKVSVVYHGVVPDLFQANRDAVVEGRMDAAGVFQADLLMTKCASKYESQDGQAHPATDPQACPNGETRRPS